jgi:SAM-dependent methyltransferase
MIDDELHSGDSHAGAQHFSNLVRSRLNPEKRRNILVAGCGLGTEAMDIRRNLGVPVTGVDIDQQWEQNFGKELEHFTLMPGSVLDLPFSGGSFDVIFYHHVIEHVADPARSLDELFRVLNPGGLIYVGAPNRHRAVGYIGSPGTDTATKIKWNIVDYRARLQGRFRNECGAHAGFTQSELSNLLARRFTDVESLTADYLNFKYGDRLPKSFLNLVCSKSLIDVAAPSVYALAKKPLGAKQNADLASDMTDEAL